MVPTFYKGFQSLLYHTLIYRDEHEVKEVARKMGVSASALYAYCEGDRTFPPDLIATLYLATGNEEFLQFCLKGTGFCLARLPGADQGSPCLKTETLEVMAAVGRLAGRVNEALGDQQLDQGERAELEQLVTRVEQAAEEVRGVLHRDDERPGWARKVG